MQQEDGKLPAVADHPESQRSGHREKVPALLGFSGLSILLSGILVYRHIAFILTTGNNCLTNDYQYLLPTVDSILSSSVDWGTVLHKFFTNSHFVFLPTLFCCLNAACFSWDVRIDCLAGIVLAAVRCLFFFDSLTQRENQRYTRWLVFLSIFALTFGSTALSCFDFGQASITGGIGMLGFAVGIWGASKFSGALKGDLLMLAGGVVVALCAGYWLPAWVAFGATLILCRVRTLRTWLFFAFGFCLSAVPTLLHLGVNSADAPKLVSIFNYSFILNTLGRCFAKRIGVTSEPLFLSQLAGLLALCALIAFFVLAPLRRSDKRYAAAFGIGVFGWLSIWLTSFFRSSVAPWYAGFAVFVWIGLFGCAGLCIAEQFDKTRRVAWASTFKIVGLFHFLICGILYMLTNLKMQDMDFWADTRSEATESCVRNFAIAPTYSERTVFLGHIGDFSRFYNLSEALNRRGWSAASKRQVWSLQGDFILPTVSVHALSQQAAVEWVKGTGEKTGKRSWSDPEHLNLLLRPPALLSWKSTIPEHAVVAEFRTRMLLGTGQIRIISGAKVIKDFKPSKSEQLSIDLIPLRGQDVELQLSSKELGEPTIFEHPTLQATTDGSSPKHAKTKIPCNTSDSKYFPIKTPQDVVLSKNGSKWSESDLKKTGVFNDRFSTYQTFGTQPKLVLNEPVSVSPREFSHFSFEVRADSTVKTPRAACIGFVINQKRLIQKIIPLLPIDTLHGYSYDLKLLELDSSDQITGLEILPIYVRSAGDTCAIQVGDIRFNRAPPPLQAL